MSDIELKENGESIRKRFTDRFIMPWDAFLEKNKEWTEYCEKRGLPVKQNERYLWEMLCGAREVSFERALSYLKALPGRVLLMSENAEHPRGRGILVNGTEQIGAVAVAKADERADLIAFEWYEGWKLWARDMYLADAVLPEDLYVFDESMDHLLVFTHENDDWALELAEPMIAAESRYCLMVGFE